MFSRLKDFRRVATRYDKLAVTYDAAVLIAAMVIWWLMLASMAKLSPPTRPSAMQRRTTRSNSRRSRFAVAEAPVPVVREGRVVRRHPGLALMTAKVNNFDKAVAVAILTC
jgi:hypothetical protein